MEISRELQEFFCIKGNFSDRQLEILCGFNNTTNTNTNTNTNTTNNRIVYFRNSATGLPASLRVQQSCLRTSFTSNRPWSRLLCLVSQLGPWCTNISACRPSLRHQPHRCCSLDFTPSLLPSPVLLPRPAVAACSAPGLATYPLPALLLHVREAGAWLL